MNTDPYAECRAALARLIQEFALAANDVPIFHERLSGLPDQPLTERAWEDFRLADYRRFDRLKKGDWQEWVSHPDGLVCSRFVGSGDKAALDRLRRLADTGMTLLRTAALGPESPKHFEASIIDRVESAATDETYLGWLDAVHLTAKQCRTLVLDVKIGNWGYKRSPYETVEEVASAMSAPTDAGLVAFPIHPIVESLQDDVFRSSAEAIKVWLDAEDVARVGEWPARPPIYLPAAIQERQQDAGEQEGHAPPAVVDSGEQHEPSTTSAPPKLIIDRETFSAWCRGKKCELGNTKLFHVLERLNQRPGAYVSVSNLIDDVWKNEDTEVETVQRTVSNLRKVLEAKLTGVTIKPQKDHYALILS